MWPDRAMAPQSLRWQQSCSEREGGLETPTSASDSALLALQKDSAASLYRGGSSVMKRTWRYWARDKDPAAQDINI